MTDLYAVIGNPIAHSQSPLIHTTFARQTCQDLHYDAILAPHDKFVETITAFQQKGGKGMNVTVPFKLEAYQLATQLTHRAQIAQAVNTLKFDGDQILGDNTDGAGLVRDIQLNLGISITNKRVLLMGAGGAARGVILPILEQNPSVLAIANRTAHKAHTLRDQFVSHGEIISGGFLDFPDTAFDIIINATSASLNNTVPELSPKNFAPQSLAYDMMYSREHTPFLKFAQRQNVGYLADGIGMLVEQAAESFSVWRGIRPDTKNVIERLKCDAY